MKIEEQATGLRFFKFLLPGFITSTSIPHAFAKDHLINMQEKCREEATLVSSAAKIWHVDVYKKHDDMYMGGEGWQQFVAANGLALGQLLVFRYRGNMVFSFRVFNPSTTFESTVKDRSIVEPAKQSSKKRKVESSKPQGYFEVIINKTHTKFCCTHIPVKFRESSGLREEDKEVSISDPKGRLWHIGLFWRTNGKGNHASMTKGWIAFARANELREGDKCVFELVAQGSNKVFSFFKIDKND